jgi:hypothetical protein
MGLEDGKICMEKKEVKIGAEFYRLTVIGIKETKPNRIRYTASGEARLVKDKRVWICKCVCGNLKEARTSYLKTGITKSCGCLIKETRKSRKTNQNGSHTEYLTGELTQAEALQAKRIIESRDAEVLEFKNLVPETIDLIIRDRQLRHMVCHSGTELI